MLVAIVAVDSNYGIGLNGTMPWINAEDLKHFKDTTMGHKVILGHTTYSNLNTELPGRDVIVASRHHCTNASVMTFQEIINEFSHSDELVYVAGGQAVYEALIDHCSMILLSRLNQSYCVDRYFPKDKLKLFELENVEHYNTFTLEKYRRIE